MATALVIVDVQNDFCEGGALAVEGGSQVAKDIATFVGPNLDRARARGYDYVVATRDAHIDPGTHFSDDPDYVDTWPRHCVVGTKGQELHPAVASLPFDAIFDKGNHEAAYSGFEGSCQGTSLHKWLNDRGVLAVDIVGLATDHCVRATALDAAKLGYFTSVRFNLCAAVSPDSLPAVTEELQAQRVLVLS